MNDNLVLTDEQQDLIDLGFQIKVNENVNGSLSLLIFDKRGKRKKEVYCSSCNNVWFENKEQALSYAFEKIRKRVNAQVGTGSSPSKPKKRRLIAKIGRGSGEDMRVLEVFVNGAYVRKVLGSAKVLHLDTYVTPDLMADNEAEDLAWAIDQYKKCQHAVIG